MCQHGPNIKDFGLRWACHNAARTPPRKEKLMLMQANNAVGSNTPGAASSAADFEGIEDGFWEGFGRPKSSIFAIFSRKNGSKK